MTSAAGHHYIDFYAMKAGDQPKIPNISQPQNASDLTVYKRQLIEKLNLPTKRTGQKAGFLKSNKSKGIDSQTL